MNEGEEEIEDGYQVSGLSHQVDCRGIYYERDKQLEVEQVEGHYEFVIRHVKLKVPKAIRGLCQVSSWVFEWPKDLKVFGI